MRSTAIIDTGPLVAAINGDDPHHRWAAAALRGLRGRALTCEAALTEAVHLLANDRAAVGALRVLARRMEVVPLAPARVAAVLAEVEAAAPRLDYADACALLLARDHPGAFVLTTDFRDFSALRVPFASPQGVFHA